MSRPVQNFRGMKVAVLHADDRNRAVLADTLAKFGVSTLLLDPQDSEAVPAGLCDSVDMLFFDADAPDDALAACAGRPTPIPLVAMLGLETPSRLQRAFELGPCALLHKPIRPTGIYTALFFAANEHRRRQELEARLAEVEARHEARRFVIKAVMSLAERHGVDDEEAFRMLRREAMQQRLTVEELAIRIVARAPQGPTRKLRA
jgi:AmiR/NasT family two-component response regulator